MSNKFKNEEETRSSLLKNKNWDWTIILYQGKTFSTTKKLLFFCTFETENISLKHTLDFDNFKGNSLLKRDFYYFLCWILSFIKKYRVLFKSNSANIWQFFIWKFSQHNICNPKYEKWRTSDRNEKMFSRLKLARQELDLISCLLSFLTSPNQSKPQKRQGRPS